MAVNHTDKPLLLIDIDGVLNCFGDLGTSLVSFEQELQAQDPGGLRTFTIRVPLGARESLLRLAKVFEPLWCTTWEENAHSEIGTQLGFDEWPHIVFDNIRQREGAGPFTWKLDTVIASVGDRALAWIDDELYSDAASWAETRNRRIPTLLIPTAPQYGIEEAQVEKLIHWAAEIKPAQTRCSSPG